MQEDLKYDYIIVGGGLAAMLMAWELTQKNQSVLIYADTAPASSNVAAGTWNPVNFRRMIPTWRATEMITAMKNTYAQIEAKLGTQFLQMIEVEKILTNNEEKQFWEAQGLKETSEGLINPKTGDLDVKGEMMFTGYVNETGRLDLPLFVEKLQSHFEEKKALIKAHFEHDELVVHADTVTYQNVQANKIIFAEGTYCADNPFFNWLPFKSVKGDVLTIKSKDLKVTTIRKKNIFILPLGNDTYKVGATYDHSTLDWAPSEKGKQQIIEKFEKITDCDYEVIGHASGIRPATHDRRPFIGAHPKHENVLIFNGLGSKGVFLGPLLAQEFSNFLLNNSEIHPEVSVKRCLKKYWINN